MLAALFLLNACESKADNSLAPTDALTPFDEANVAWAECRAKVVLAGVKTELTANELVDKAFQACATFEGQFYSAGIAEFGPEWLRSEGDGQRENFKQAMIVRIKELRAGKPASNPGIAWGKCIRTQTYYETGSSDPIEMSVDRIMKACRTYQDAVEADAQSQLGREVAQQGMGESLPKIRAILADDIRQLRANSHRTNTQRQ